MQPCGECNRASVGKRQKEAILYACRQKCAEKRHKKLIWPNKCMYVYSFSVAYKGQQSLGNIFCNAFEFFF